MDERYARAYAELYRRHWWWRARERFLMNTAHEELSPNVRHRILDVGAGSGLFFQRLSELGDVWGVETDENLRTGVPAIDDRIHWGSLESYRPETKFTAILFLDVLEHVTDPVALLRAGLALLERGGVVIVTVPAFMAIWTRHDALNEHKTRFSRSSFRQVATAAGVRERTTRYFFHWLVAAKFAVRLVEAVNGGSARADLPHVPGRILNAALYGVSRGEQLLGLHRFLPWGSSLLYVGVRD